MDSYANQAGYYSFPSMGHYQSWPHNSCCNHGLRPSYPQPMPLHYCPAPRYPGFYAPPETMMPWSQGHHPHHCGPEYRMAEEPRAKGSLVPVHVKGYPKPVVWIPEEYLRSGRPPLDRNKKIENARDAGDVKKARDQKRHFPFPVVWMPPRRDSRRDVESEGGKEANVSPKQTENLPFVFGVLPTNQTGGKDRNSGNGRKLHRKALSETEAAKLIQSAFRGFEVRRSRPLKKLKRMAEVRDRVADVQERIRALESPSGVHVDEKQKLIIGETIMRLLLQLDTIQGLHPSLRDMRKSLAKELVSLQEKLDTLPVIEPENLQSEDHSAGLGGDCKQGMPKDTESESSCDVVANNIRNVVDSSQDQLLPDTVELELEHAIKCEESMLSPSDDLVSEGDGHEVGMDLKPGEPCSEAVVEHEGEAMNDVPDDVSASKLEDSVEMSKGPAFEKAGGCQLDENIVGVNHAEAALGESRSSAIDGDEHAKAKLEVEQVETGDSEAVVPDRALEEVTSSQGTTEEGPHDDDQSTRQLLECEKVVGWEDKADHERNETGRSNTEKWLQQENEKLREMMEKLLEEQVNVMYRLSGRVKHLEKTLSRKSKFRTKQHFRRRSLVNYDE